MKKYESVSFARSENDVIRPDGENSSGRRASVDAPDLRVLGPVFRVDQPIAKCSSA
jgi:hypothetical protein